MKYFSAILLICLNTFLSSNVYSQTSNSGRVRTFLINLFKISVERNYEKVAPCLVYRSDDSSRKWVDVYDFGSENERDRKSVISMTNEIRNLIENGGEYEFLVFTKKVESEGEWLVWEVNFEKVPGNKVYFACLKIKGKYALGDIDY